MTTQELKQYIDRVLGNNIRCLLPSYWWKRLFISLADRVDEVEQSTSKLIDSKVEEVKMPIVESVDELEKLNVEKGGLAAVEKVGEPVIVNYEDCYTSLDYVNDWDKYTIIKGVSEIGEVPSDAEGDFIPLIADKYDLEADTIVIGIEDGRRAYGKHLGGGFSYLTLDKVNEYLASGRYRLCGGYLSDRISQYFTFYSAFPQPSLYIKGDSWEKLSKEYVVSSEEELNALSVENGTIAKVAREEEKFVGVGTLLQYEDGIDYNSLFTVKKVSISVPKTSIGELSLVYLSTKEKNITLTIVCSADGKDGYIQAWYEDGRKVDLMREQTLVQSNIDDLNSYLSKNVVRYISAGASSGSHFEFIDTWFKVATPYTVADAYIKGETWTRLLKEGDATGLEVRELYIIGDDVVTGNVSEEYTAEQLAYNKETVDLYKQGKVSLVMNATIKTLNLDISCTPLNYINTSKGTVICYEVNAVIARAMILVTVDNTGNAQLVSDDINSGSITIDSELSDTSENAVQNKVITAALNNKADKVDGKQLSTEDFTTALKTKLEGLNNYDDTSIQNSVNSLTTQINTLVSGDASAAIESFNEIISFLDGIEDSESLDSIIASIEQQISNKQNKIEDLETIRSGAALGATALQEHQDISHLATKEEVTNLQNEVIANEEVVATSLNDLNTRIEEIAENVGGAAATKEELAEAIEGVNATITEKETATNEAIAGVSASVDALRNDVAETYATKEDLEETNESLANLTNEILTNEEITAAAFADLNTRLLEVVSRLDALENN